MLSRTTNALNKFASGMADIQMERNPLSQEVILVFNEVLRDHYQDAVSSEQIRIKKRAMVHKDQDMHYVQQEPDLLLEDSEHLPWTVAITTTSLPRTPQLDDQIVIEGLRYNISYVKPVNRQIDTIIWLSVYPERNDVDPLAIYSVSKLPNGYLDIVYGGNPTEMAFSLEGEYDESLRVKFDSRPRVDSLEGYILLFDADLNVFKYKYKV